MIAYTDYPFTSLGDTEYQKAPMRECHVIHWDGDKYATIRIEGVVESLKAGYLYVDSYFTTPISSGDLKVSQGLLSFDEAGTALRDGLCVQRAGFADAPVFALFYGDAVLMYGSNEWGHQFDVESGAHDALPRYDDYEIVDNPNPDAEIPPPSQIEVVVSDELNEDW